MRSARFNVLAAFVVGCVIAGTALGLWSRTEGNTSRIEGNTSAQLDTCRQVQKLSGVIQAVVLQDLQTLGKPGSPGFAYYREHPAELASTRLSLQQEAAQFAPKRCH